MNHSAALPRIAACCFVGFSIGVVGGLIGLGGAELRLPFLVGALGLALRAAVPLNLAISLATVAAAAPARLLASDLANLAMWLPEAASIAAGAMVAAYLGAGWLRSIPASTLRQVVCVLLVGLGVVMIIEVAVPLTPDGILPAIPVVRILAGLGFGFVIGIISSLLGVAGGEVIIPVLVVAYGIPVILSGTLSLMISLPTIVVGIGRHLTHGAYRERTTIWSIGAPMTVGALVGAPIGGWASAYAPAAGIKLLLGGLLIWSAFKVFGHKAA